MREFQERRKIRGFFYSKKMIVLLLLIFAFLSYFTVKLYFKNRNALAKRDEIRKELADLEERRAGLQNDVSRLNTESGMEQEIRDKFNVQKPGEQALIIVDKSAENVKIESGGLGSFFNGIWGWIKSKF
jgi:cell division protein FtsB